MGLPEFLPMQSSCTSTTAGPLSLFASVFALSLAGCTTPGGGSADIGHYVVSAPQTPMYRYGPAQSFGPDFSLQQGQHVVMLKREYGYSRVQTDEGQSGFVATEDLAPAPAPKPGTRGAAGSARIAGPGGVSYPKLPPLSPTGTSRPGVSSANNKILEGGALFGPGDLPPLPTHGGDEEERPAAKPEFRFPKPKPGFRVNVPAPDSSAKPDAKPNS
jgi:hypothetical protein